LSDLAFPSQLSHFLLPCKIVSFIFDSYFISLCFFFLLREALVCLLRQLFGNQQWDKQWGERKHCRQTGGGSGEWRLEWKEERERGEF